MTKTFIDGMIENEKGHIVTISSMSGMYAFPQNLTYSATKHAVNGFMLSLNEYLRAKRLDKIIKTSCVMPVFIDTIPVVSTEYRNPK
jgi:all-trans-retinol dehydrogenase (NAD+)